MLCWTRLQYFLPSINRKVHKYRTCWWNIETWEQHFFGLHLLEGLELCFGRGSVWIASTRAFLGRRRQTDMSNKVRGSEVRVPGGPSATNTLYFYPSPSFSLQNQQILIIAEQSRRNWSWGQQGPFHLAWLKGETQQGALLFYSLRSAGEWSKVH